MKENETLTHTLLPRFFLFLASLARVDQEKLLVLSFDDAIPLMTINTHVVTFILFISYISGKNVLHSVRLHEIDYRLLR
jgi:hypothetical protein